MIEILERFDRALLLQINALHTPLLDTFMWYASATWPVILMVIAIAFAFYKKYSTKKAAEFLLGCAIVFACTDFSANMVKHGVKRYRPTHNTEIQKQVHLVNDYQGGQYGFFSGHASNTFGTVTFIFLCLRWVPRNRKIWLFLVPFIVCYSRVYLGVHYPSDIFFGLLDGLFFGWLGYRIMNFYFLKLDANQEAA